MRQRANENIASVFLDSPADAESKCSARWSEWMTRLLRSAATAERLSGRRIRKSSHSYVKIRSKAMTRISMAHRPSVEKKFTCEAISSCIAFPSRSDGTSPEHTNRWGWTQATTTWNANSGLNRPTRSAGWLFCVYAFDFDGGLCRIVSWTLHRKNT